MRGSSGLAEHLSFLVTILAGHTAVQGSLYLFILILNLLCLFDALKTCTLLTKMVHNPITTILVFARAAGREAPCESSSKARITVISASANQGAAVIKRKIALAAVVCSSLTQLGDCNLVLNLLAPSIAQELVSSKILRSSVLRFMFICFVIPQRCLNVDENWVHCAICLQVNYPSLSSVHSFLCAVAVLVTDKRSDSSALPEALLEILPRCVCEFLIALFMVSDQSAFDNCLILSFREFLVYMNVRSA